MLKRKSDYPDSNPLKHPKIHSSHSKIKNLIPIQQLRSESTVSSFSRHIYIAKSKTGKRWYFKAQHEKVESTTEELNLQLAEIEVVTGNLLRFFHPAHPKHRLAKIPSLKPQDPSKKKPFSLGVATQEILGYQSLGDFSDEKIYHAIKYEQLHGFGVVCVLAFLFKDSDLRVPNLGIVKGTIISIDGDHRFNYEEDTITGRDYSSLPYLTYCLIKDNWLDQMINGKIVTSFR